MITSTLIATTVTLSVLLAYGKNPVKLSAMILIICFIIFSIIMLKSGSSWYPLLFLLLFTGGILMMFMILASIMPNESFGKTKMMGFKVTLIMSILSMTAPLVSPKAHMAPSPGEIKSLLETSGGMIILALIILCYFFVTMTMLKSNKLPMRNVIFC